MVGGNKLYEHYTTNVDLIAANTFTLTEIDNMIPFERDVYIDLLNSKEADKK